MCRSVDIGEDIIVKGLLEKAIESFESMLDKANTNYRTQCDLVDMPKIVWDRFEIDTDGIGDDGKPYLKIIDNLAEEAFAVTLDTIVQSYKDKVFDALIRALQTGIFERVHGITRIVGYMSRTSNWNKSKIGELKDRHKGNYLWKTSQSEQTEESGCVGDLCHV
ncbi:MAG: anaerobic ribonucleoside-triphosphate reductase [Podoviridae sp. cty5g4]|nr:MAG: anaerobic ribonucleoside-triphosphate reductase [Podoviridae sp. cty5g4]